MRVSFFIHTPSSFLPSTLAAVHFSALKFEKRWPCEGQCFHSSGVNFNLGRFAVKCVPWCGGLQVKAPVIDVAYSSAFPRLLSPQRSSRFCLS